MVIWDNHNKWTLLISVFWAFSERG